MFKEWFDMEIEIAASEKQGLAMVDARFSEHLEDEQPMYRMILISHDDADMDAKVLAEGIRNLLEDDALSVSEKDSISPAICCTTEDEQAYRRG